MKKIKKALKDFWSWLWESESIWSYIVFLAIVFVVVKFIFLPVLGFFLGTSLPLAIVESSSMYHGLSRDDAGTLRLCGNSYTSKQSINFDEYWQVCGNWYEKNTNITKEQFKNFSFKNGFSKGDLMIIIGKKNIEIGDIIIFDGGSKYPIIHRVISLSPLQTKGDHNPGQLPAEKNIQESQIIGVAKARIPYIGWIKLFFVEIFK